MWAVILITSGLVIGLVIVHRGDTPTIDYAMVAIVGVLVAAQLFLVLELSHPYLGEIPASPEPLFEVIRTVSPPPA